MIRPMIFDLDGTLVKTERLKALSYARSGLPLAWRAPAGRRKGPGFARMFP